MKRYYFTRLVISTVFGGLVYVVSGSLITGLVSAVLAFIIFVFLSRSGRYKVVSHEGATALRRDEWTLSINQRSGRNAWAVVAILGSGLVLYYGLISPGDVPVGLVSSLLFSGMLTYYISDFWLRKM